jgi:hypothetical protein
MKASAAGQLLLCAGSVMLGQQPTGRDMHAPHMIRRIEGTGRDETRGP